MNIYRETKKRGIKWLIRGIFRRGIEAAAKCITLLLLAVPRIFFYFFNRKVLTVFYEFSFCPPTFDAMAFFMGAEMERRKKNCTSISVVFFTKCTEKNLQQLPSGDQGWFDWRFDHVVLPAMRLFHFITSYNISTSKWKCFKKLGVSWNIYPYNPLIPIKQDFMKIQRKTLQILKTAKKPWGIRAKSAALNFIDDWINQTCKDKNLIVITLRNSPNHPKRNSNVTEWGKFAKSCDLSLYSIVFVLDTDTALKGIPKELEHFTFFDAACWNLDMRMALYQRAYLNLFTSGGPPFLCILNNQCRYLYFKIIADEPTARTSDIAAQGFLVGHTPPWASPFQKWVWEEDSFEIIKREFDKMCEVISASEYG